MPKCSRCGEVSPDSATHCSKCGIAFRHQFQAKADATHAKTGLAIRTVSWIVGLVLLAAVAPRVYHTVGLAVLNYRLHTMTESAMKACGGPVTASMMQYQKDQIDKCLANDEDLVSAKSAYSSFAGTGKP